ncbi:MAG: sensor histidine kinase [Candidatus Alkaliphilus sp. MAG34]|nr:GHKL domain-containing protein [Clostridiales bacterium]
MKSRIPKFSQGNKKEGIKALFLTQIFLIMTVTLYLCLIKWGLIDKRYYAISVDAMLVTLLLLSGLIGVGSICLFNEVENLLEKEKEHEVQKFQIMQMQESNDLLRSQKHDFSNNLQVLWGLLSLGNMEKAKEYLDKYSGRLNIDEKELIKLSRISCTHLHTLLLNKAYKCKNRGIEINYYIQPSISLEEFNPIDIVGILGNLMDNAIYEVEKLGAGHGSITVDIYCNEKEYVFRVNNKGTVIPEETMAKIFEKGFTTKGDEGEGFGLYNVKGIVKKYSGKIYVKSDVCMGTSFSVHLPRERAGKNTFLKKVMNGIQMFY